MTGQSAPHESPRHPKGEGELTAQLITAASQKDENLSQDEIDRILGVRSDDT